MKKNKGITLIALIITIIVLLILAGITITFVLGNNGLFTITKQAKEQTIYAAAKEIIDLKLMDIISDCYNNEKEYNILEVAKGMKESKEITIEQYYNSDVASIKEGITENLVNLKGIVLSVDQYQKYLFLIGEDGKKTGVFVGNITEETNITDFKEINQFEKEMFRKQSNESEEIKVDISVLDDIEEFKKAIKDQKKLEYIINNSDIFMKPILEKLELLDILFKEENAVNLIIKNDTWRSEILKSNGDKSGENSSIIKTLDNSNPINLPTSNLTLYNEENPNGNVLYSSYLRNEEKHSPKNAFIGGVTGDTDWETTNPNGLPAYIGYDFGIGNETWIYKVYVKGGNNTTPTKMYLQSSEDNITWNTIYEFTRYTTAGNYITEVIDSESNNKKSRYWRLYITESKDMSSGYVDLLKIQFYGK